MKKYICPIEDDPMFKALYGKTFNEYITELENHKKEVAERIEAMGSSPPVSDMSILDDYNYLDEGDEL